MVMHFKQQEEKIVVDHQQKLASLKRLSIYKMQFFTIVSSRIIIILTFTEIIDEFVVFG